MWVTSSNISLKILNPCCYHYDFGQPYFAVKQKDNSFITADVQPYRYPSRTF